MIPLNLEGHRSVMEVFVFVLSDPRYQSSALADMVAYLEMFIFSFHSVAPCVLQV